MEVKKKNSGSPYTTSSSLSLSPFVSCLGRGWRDLRAMEGEESEGEEADGSCPGAELSELLLLLSTLTLHSVSLDSANLGSASSFISFFSSSLHSSLFPVGEEGAEGMWGCSLVLRLASLKLARGGRRRTPLRVEPSMPFWSCYRNKFFLINMWLHF